MLICFYGYERSVLKINLVLVTIILSICLGSCKIKQQSIDSPYPKSPVIESIKWEFTNIIRLALGSDLWPVTWAADDNIYTSWGDGVGFGAIDWKEQGGKDRSSLGFSRIEGMPPNITAINVWGGKNPENPATFDGKSPSIISVDGTIYGWLNIQNDPNFWDYQLIWSSNLGKTWHKANWKFSSGRGKFFPQSFLNFQKDYTGSRDDFVYFYGREWGDKFSDGVAVFLGRVNKEKIKNRNAYEFFMGLDLNRRPQWTTDINRRKPVLMDQNGIITSSVIFNQAIKRYIMTTCRGMVGQLGIFDAPEPWGPWTTIAYYNNWGGFEGAGLFYHFPTKWISSDGKTMWCIFSSTGKLDSFNLIKATLKIKKEPIVYNVFQKNFLVTKNN